MSSDAFTPITTSRQIDTPQGYRIYTTTRDVAAEFPIPVVGTLMTESNFIAGFPGHYILQVNDYPRINAKRVVVTHGPLPSGSFTEWESLAYTFPAIYPNSATPTFFPNGSRQRQRVVPAEVTYEYQTTATAWLDDPVIWDFADPATGPFEIDSVLIEAAGVNFVDGEGSSGLVGQFLNPSFITQDTLNDAITIYSPGDLLYNIGASTPSATQYAAWYAAKTKIITSRTIHRWYCFYMRRTSKVRVQ